jgi:hypothetical protein
MGVPVQNQPIALKQFQTKQRFIAIGQRDVDFPSAILKLHFPAKEQFTSEPSIGILDKFPPNQFQP